jgi:hypothetical protein
MTSEGRPIHNRKSGADVHRDRQLLKPRSHFFSDIDVRIAAAIELLQTGWKQLLV